MAVVLHLSPLDTLRCRFAVSPLWEALAAVRALREDSGRHAPWLAGLDVPALRARLAPLLLLQPTAGYVPDFLTPPPRTAVTTVEAELARVAATPAQDVERELRAALSGSEDPAARSLLADPTAARDQLVALEEQAWQLLVAPHWPRLRRLLEADVAHQAARLAREGLAPVLSDLHPRVRVRGSELVVEGLPHDSRELAGEGLVLLPSAFSWPRACLLSDPAYSPMLVYLCRGVAALWAAATPAPDALIRLLGRGRAAVLDALATPDSTTRLAAALGLSAGTVSEHLTALLGAGLLIRQRSGPSVHYSRTALGDALVAAQQAPRVVRSEP